MISISVRITSCLLSAILAAGNMNSQADEVQTIKDAISGGQAKVNLRYRYEHVDQDNISKDAGASTLRTRFSWQSAALNQFSFGIEVDDVSIIGSERYNSTENSKAQYPVVADPEGLDLNQIYLKYSGEKSTGTLGRQRIVHGSQRFVGGVAWRQNEQTYDAIRYEYNHPKNWSIDYAYTWNVNRIFGPDDGAQPSDWHGNTHFLRTTFNPSKLHTLTAFAYLLEFDNANGVPNSTDTFGIDYKGSMGAVTISASAATQSDAGDSPLDYDAEYYLLQADLKLSSITLTAGIEVLGSDDGLASFRTPLATLHKFQGWADKFLMTPAAGIEDTYIGVKGKAGPVYLAATWHEFSPEEGSGDYGSEFNAVATWPVQKNLVLQLKYADYTKDGFSVDTTKLWASIIIKL